VGVDGWFLFIPFYSLLVYLPIGPPSVYDDDGHGVACMPHFSFPLLGMPVLLLLCGLPGSGAGIQPSGQRNCSFRRASWLGVLTLLIVACL